MQKQITFKIAFIAFSVGCLFSSCLKKDLPALPLYSGNDITNVYVEYRYPDTSRIYNGQPTIAYQKLTVTQTIDAANNKVSLDITIPSASGSFTQSIRKLVSQTDLILYFDISTAATMSPTEGTPAPGYSTDLTKPQSYVVTAADGEKRTWTIEVTSFTK